MGLYCDNNVKHLTKLRCNRTNEREKRNLEPHPINSITFVLPPGFCFVVIPGKYLFCTKNATKRTLLHFDMIRTLYYFSTCTLNAHTGSALCT